MEVEECVDVKEEGFISVSEEADIGIKQEEIPEDITFPDIKSEPDEVSCVCVCVSVIRHILPGSTFGNINVLLLFLGWRERVLGVCGMVCT